MRSSAWAGCLIPIENSREVDLLEQRLADHDEQILALVRAIRQLASPAPVPKKRRIGFHAEVNK